MKIQLELTEEQALAVVKACDFFMRVNMGQFDEILSLFRFSEGLNFTEIDQAHIKLNQVKFLLTKMSPGQFISASSPKLNQQAKIACDLHDTIRHFLAWEKQPEGGWTTNFNPPLNVSNTGSMKISKIE